MILESVLWLSIFVALTAAVYTWWRQKYSRFYSLLNRIPGPKCYPIVGNMFELLKPSDALFRQDRELAKKYYPIYREWSFNSGMVNLYHPDDIELILSSHKHLDKSDVYDFLHSWLGTGLLTSGGAKWQIRRKILTPAFHFSILQNFVPLLNDETKKLLQWLECQGNTQVDVIAPITQFTLFSIAETSMGIKLDSSLAICKEYQNAIYTFGQTLTYRLLRPWLHNDAIFSLTKIGKSMKSAIKTLHDFSRKVIEERKMNFVDQVGERRRKAMLDLLLSAKAAGADIDDEGIREEVDTFMFEGHDTTAVAICYTLLLLANHESVQEELYQEIVEVLGSAIKTPTFNDLKNLTFMERCLKESLRLFPSVPFISREISEDVKTATGYIIPKGAMANIQIYDLHRNPEFYPDPEKFDPDRFLPENTKNRHPFAFIPFSAGSRNCIGQKFAMLELKIVLCGILRKYKLKAVNKPEDVVLLTDMVLRCKEEIKIEFIRRV